MKRLILFDIDGTLVWGGPAKKAFEVAMEEVFGTAGPIGVHDFSGKTDPQIARELLRLEGLDDNEIDAGFDRLWREYLGELKARLPDTPMTVLPGVRLLLEHLDALEDVALGLLTGNVVEGARLKLGSVELLGYFPVGGFGSDSEIREDLAPVAMQRAAKKWEFEFSSSSVVVVGDTPRDVACGKHSGTRTVAVATGRHDAEKLAAAEPNRILKDLSDLEETLTALLA
jgi:phosphoglycolate phosphatase-like HAD superfamily hydrolase